MRNFHAVLALAAASSADWINEEVHRDIFVRDAIVETNTVFKVRRGKLKDNRQYQVQVAHYSRVGDLQIFLNDVGVDAPVMEDLSEDVATFAVPFSGASSTVRVSTVAGNLLVPLPAQVLELEKQFVYFSWKLIVESPHHSDQQLTTVVLPPGALLENASPLERMQVAEGRLTLGPFSAEEVLALKNEQVHLHFSHNHPMPYLGTVAKRVEVSHLGAAVSVHEAVTLVNAAAGLKGEFNRVPYTHMKFSRDGSSPFAVDHTVMDMGAVVPFEAVNIHYRDVIGNISSSTARRVSEDGVKFTYVQVAPRFPLLGGWKSEFEFSYDLPSTSVLFEENRRKIFLLTVPLSHGFPHLFANEQKVSVVLPAGASDISVSTKKQIVPGSFRVEDTLSWLDSPLLPWSRKTVSFTLGATYIGPNDCLTEKLFVQYSISGYAFLQAPFLLTLYLFVLISGILLARRISFHICNPEEAKLIETQNFDYDICKVIEDSLTDLSALNSEVLEATKDVAQKEFLSEMKDIYLAEHQRIVRAVEAKCTQFVSEQNRVGRTVRILMNLKAQKDAAIAHLDTVAAGKDGSVSGSKLVDAEHQVESLVGRVLTGQATPPPSPSGSPPSKEARKRKS